MKKFLKEAGIETDRDQNLYAETVWGDSPTGENQKQTGPNTFLSLELICQYESAMQGEILLKRIGMGNVNANSLHVEKISAAANKFCNEEPSSEMRKLCRLVEKSVLSTPWNLS